MKDLKIRQLSRPKIVQDNKFGYNTIQRKYVVQGDKVVRNGVFSSQITGDISVDGVPLFLEIGEEDTEYKNFYLTNQTIEPSQSSMEKAYLTRTFVDLRDTFISENISESKDFKKITRSYVVLRKAHERGYSETNFQKHPSVEKSGIYDAWDYLPRAVENTRPSIDGFNSNIISANNFPRSLKTPQLNNSNLFIALSNSKGVCEPLESNAKVDISNPGVDLWQVSWTIPLEGYWSTATTSTQRNSIDLPQIVRFDQNGLSIMDWGDISGGSEAAQAWKYTFFHVGDSIPEDMVAYTGGSGGNSWPSVWVDIYLEGFGSGSGFSHKQLIKNAVFKKSNSAIVSFKTTEDTNVNVGQLEGQKNIILNYDCGDKAPAVYQGKPISKAGGRITWGASYVGSLNRGYSERLTTRITPISSFKGKRLWKIELTFVS